MQKFNRSNHFRKTRIFLKTNLFLFTKNLFTIKYFIVIVLVVTTTIIKLFLSEHFIIDSPFLLMITAILISAVYGGWGPGVFATILTTLSINYYFLRPLYTFKFYPDATLQLIIYILEGLIVTYVAVAFKQSLRRAEQKTLELQRSEKRFRLLVDGVKDYAIFVLDPDGFIDSWNEGAKRITGYTENEIIRKHISILYPEKDTIKRTPWEHIKTATLIGRFYEEAPRVKKNKSTYWASTLITALNDETGDLRGFLCVMQDQSERKKIEQRKDEFISIASHELKTPLTSMKIFTQLLKSKFEKIKDKESTNFLGKMESQINKLTVLINDLLDVSRIQSGKLSFNLEYFDINDLIKETAENMQIITSQHVIQIDGSFKKKLYADRDRIGQVLINFITNAIKYSPDADKIIIGVEKREQSIQIKVQDFGLGIDPAFHEKVFDRFFRVSNENQKSFPGLGMGLYISSEIIKRHNGRIWVESEMGKGSIFYFSLPTTPL